MDTASQGQKEILEVIVHKLKEPLSTILLRSKVLSTWATQPNYSGLKMQKGLAKIIESAESMNLLIENISNQPHSTCEQNSSSVDVSSLIRQVYAVFQPIAEHCSIQFQVSFNNIPESIKAKRDHIFQALSCLVSDAFSQAHKDAVIILEVSVKENSVFFTVKDTASETFADGMSTNKNFNLLTMRKIVEDHQGKTWLENINGKTQMSFSIPHR